MGTDYGTCTCGFVYPVAIPVEEGVRGPQKGDCIICAKCLWVAQHDGNKFVPVDSVRELVASMLPAEADELIRGIVMTAEGSGLSTEAAIAFLSEHKTVVRT